ncbi:Heterogeneous nuclear ribonucleoprotein L [Echinococcus granulosus]|uniref:Heterogeneous nuclear ribonucleoprotein l n=1 Tax=Echinococcus granulosus TaxID=6210 RepID=A0A068WDL1_ECHGR|nr:Heterogeneous nuclear ribonucleoprotein L [Echinococcus granulosus]CDS17805.1 heterogeneous nuclear ribonucleoprotein l [Echinococcus granulosus]
MSRKRNRPEEWGDIEPSPVIHITDLPEHTLEIDLEKLFDKYGRIVEIIMLPNKRQALVEFEDQNDADRVIQRSNEYPFTVNNQRLRLAYSTSKRLTFRGRLDDSAIQSDRPPPMENNILLLTIYNAQYPITVDVIHQVTNRHGKVLRIVIFRKTGVQAMVEFATVADARETKRHINGADIYSGCCSLKVEYAKQTRLKVTRNCLDSWDYENPTLMDETGMGVQGRPVAAAAAASLLGKFDGELGKRADAYLPGNLAAVSPNSVISALAMVAAGQQQQQQGVFGGGYSDMNDRSATPVIMVYNLNMAHANCDRLFNLFCLYGDVGPIKFLRSKEGTAMVELHGIANANGALVNLPMISFAGKRLSGQLSRQQHIVEVSQPYILPDGSPSFKDFTGSRNNRYTHDSAAKNRVYPPSRMLHFWNCPPGISSSQLQEVFAHAGVSVPNVVSLFKKNERNSSGVLEWNSVEEACDALIFCNHTVIPSPGDRVPFVMRLAFSSSGAAERRYSRTPISSSSSSNGWHLSSGKVTGGAAPPSSGGTTECWRQSPRHYYYYSIYIQHYTPSPSSARKKKTAKTTKQQMQQ